MAVDYQTIRSELRKQLLTVSSLPNKIAWENRDFEPPNPPVAYVRETLLPSNDRQAASALLEAEGLVQFDVFFPAGKGTATPEDIARDIAEAFKPGTSLGSGPYVQIDRAEPRPGGKDGPWYIKPVRVTWRSYWDK